MRHRTAKKILKEIENVRSGNIYSTHTIVTACGVMANYPREVERIACEEHDVRFWGSHHRVKPVLIHRKFGDGRYWGTLSPMNTRPNYYLVMGDSRWADDERFRDDLERVVYDAIEEQYGSDTFYCDECEKEYWDEGNTCCASEREWPALDSHGCSWCFPCYRQSSLRARFLRSIRRERRSR